MPNLIAKFNDILGADKNGVFAGAPLSPSGLDFLAKTTDGAPVVLLRDHSMAHYVPSRSLRHIVVDFQVACSVQTDADIIQDQFMVAICDSGSPELYEIFLKCFAAAAADLPETRKTGDLESIVEQLLSLFRSLENPGREISGLWAELWVIANSNNPVAAVNAWHNDAFERFDFSSNHVHLEVKSTTGEARVHEFALEQLRPPIGGGGYIASILLQQLSGGLSVIELANAIEPSLYADPTLRRKLWANIAGALGNDFSSKIDKTYDVNYAQRNLKLYKMQDIPVPKGPFHPSISAIRFKVDCSALQSSVGPEPYTSLQAVVASLSVL